MELNILKILLKKMNLFKFDINKIEFLGCEY